MIIIFRSPSGGGKTTATDALIHGGIVADNQRGTALAAELGMLWDKIGARQLVRLSADDYFTDAQGRYNFDPAHLSTAHGQCLRRFATNCAQAYDLPGKTVIIVDNTNCSIAEVAPYAALAGAYQQELYILTLLCDPAVAWRRNRHEVPLTNVVKQDLILRQSILEWPPWWPQKVFPL